MSKSLEDECLWQVASHPCKRQRSATRVIFSDRVDVLPPSTHDHDLQSRWYNREEYHRFKMECAYTIKALRALRENFGKLDQNKVCMRGLEHQMGPEVQLKRRQKREALIDMILTQQRINRLHGNSDSYQLKELSEIMSNDSRVIGQAFGRFDYQARLEC